jgi:TonB family protein
VSHRRGLLDPTPDAAAPWTTTLVVSLVLHLLCFGVALGLPHLMGRGPQGPPVYVVDLVSLPAGVPTPAAPLPGGGAPKAPPPPPKPEKAIPIPDREARKPDPKKKPPEKKEEPARKPEAKPTPTKPAPDKAAQTPPAAPGAPADAAAPGSRGTGPAGGPGAPGGTGAPGGGAGGSGMGQADAYTFYFARLRQTIETNWAKPLYPQTETLRSVLTATVRLTVTSSGRVTSLELVAPSGYEALDASVLRAIQDAQPFPPFPSELGSGAQTVQFAFDLSRN